MPEKENNRDYDRYQEKLSESVGDGGGCAEAWEAADTLRSTGRRSFIMGLAGSLLFGHSAVDVASAAEGEIPDRIKQRVRETEVIDLKGKEKSKAIRSAVSDEEVKKIQKGLKDHDFNKMDIKSATASKSVYNSGSHLVVKIPFRYTKKQNPKSSSDNNIDRKAGILWDSRNTGTHGYIETREVAEGKDISKDVKKLLDKSDVDLSDIDTVPVEVSSTTIQLKEQDSTDKSRKSELVVQANSRIVPVAKQQDEQLSTQGFADCVCTAVLGTNPVTACAPCGTVDNECLREIIAKFGAGIGVCGGCFVSGTVPAVPPSVPACLTCLGAIGASIASGSITDVCCWCNFGGDFI